MSVLDPRPHAQQSTGIPMPPRWLAVVIAALLGLAGLTGVFAIVAGIRLYGVIDGEAGFLTTDAQDLHGALSLWETAGKFQGGAYILCGALFIQWFYRTRRALGLLAPDRFRHAAGWAIGAWFVPIVNLWVPYRIAFDMWGGASPLPSDGQPHRAPVWPVNLWWALFAGNALFSRWCAARFDSADDLAELRQAAVQYMICDSLEILAAGAAILFVLRLSAMHERKVLEGPYGPAL
ncbi:hypothetical protein Stsp02_29620 [Streptomyces sp. NBRC 14336]|uniref:DUF4328 domain-containing protein n=1 Tax=Streptomyces sp. NBRC 14336 TaxID=3030992 RepID=UPI0024A234C3|nr:DUF4328 domain-containing protein [Streptomyces sp. NBRC 14336]GLW47300.1 hypothetical protein Stsp02_29620 [Streptomyces sp. NBRC 14336]